MGFALTHQLADFLRCIGLRDRLRCPMCRAVGTYKPHGGLLDKEDIRKVRRWLCKWCGYYKDKLGNNACVYSPTKKHWVFNFEIIGVEDEDVSFTPQKIISLSPIKAVWPWRG